MIPLEWKLLSRLRLQFSDLNEHKLQRSTLRGTELETNEHFPCVAIVFPVRGLNSSIIFAMLILLEKAVYLLYGSISNPNTLTKVVINLVIKFLKSTGRFYKPLIFDP